MKPKLKKPLTVALCILGIIIGILSLRAGLSGIRNDKVNNEYFSDGMRLVAYQVREYIETGDTDALSRAGADLGYLSDRGYTALVGDDNGMLLDELAKAFTSDLTRISEHAERLASAFEIIADDPTDEYAYSQIQIVLNSIS